MRIPTTFNRMGLSPSGGGGGMPTSGLVFYAPLKTNAAIAETGQSLTYSAPFEQQTFGGVESLYTSGLKYITMTDTSNLPTGNHPWTMSVWIAGKNLSSGSSFNYAASMGKIQQYSAIVLGTKGNTQFQFGPGWVDYLVNGFEENTWYHLAESFDGTNLHYYLDGQLLNSSAWNANIVYSSGSNVVTIGAINFNGYQDYFEGNIAAARIYDRALTDEEIALLATEFTKKIDPSFYPQFISFNNDEGAISRQLSFNTYGKAYSFAITSGSLPSSVSFAQSGTFIYDGTEISQDQDYPLLVELRGNELIKTSAAVTLKMRVAAGIPDDYFIYMPMTSSSAFDCANSNVASTETGNVQFTTQDGISCVDFNNNTSNYITISENGNWPGGLNIGDEPESFSFWLKLNNYDVDKPRTILSMGNVDTRGTEITIRHINESVYKGFYVDFNYGNTGNNVISGIFNDSWIDDSEWHHVCICVRNINSEAGADVYIDGSFAYTGTAPNISKNTKTVHAPQVNACNWYYYRNAPIDGYVSALRIYNRGLTQAEITALASEFTPTP